MDTTEQINNLFQKHMVITDIIHRNQYENNN